MNCQNFEYLITDLARSACIDADLRAEALAHAEACARCAARLADERTLTTSLRAFARHAAEETPAPSAKFESALLSAFRLHHGADVSDAGESPAGASLVSSQDVSSPSPLDFAARAASVRARRANLSGRRSWRVAAAAAAFVIAFTALFAARSWREMTREQEQTAQSQSAGAPSQADGARQSLRGETSGALSPSLPQVARADEADMNGEVEPVATAANSKVIKPDALRAIKDASDGEPEAHQSWGRGARAARHDARYSTVGLGSASTRARGRAAAERAAGEVEEIATDFFALAGASSLPQMDGGHIVRVEVPRSALAAFGLPVSAERMNERVKADVVLDNDGVARAIRFVR